MKTVKNELLVEIENGKSVYVKDLIVAALDQMPQGGFTRGVIKSRSRVDDALKGINGEEDILFEDQDYQTAKACIDACGWASRGPHIMRLLDLFP
jgi:hypothetical protein